MVFLYDAHCHLSPSSFWSFDSDSLSSLIVAKVCESKKDHEEQNFVSQLALMSTGRCDIKNVISLSEKCEAKFREISSLDTPNSSLQVIPCLGVHPWYSHMFYVDESVPDKKSHYNSILQSSSKKFTEVPEELLNRLPSATNFNEFCDYMNQEIQKLLDERIFPNNIPVLVGEIGVDKLSRIPWIGFLGNKINYESEFQDKQAVENTFPELSPFKISMDHQLMILEKQLDIATKNKLPVSVHCVKAHGVLYDFVFNYIKKKQGLSAICLHSYTGSIEQANVWVNINKRLPKNLSEKLPKVYFSFSNILNNNPSNIKKDEEAEQIIKCLPDDTILIETDLSIDRFYKQEGNSHFSDLLDIVKKICKCKNWELNKGISILTKNWYEFLKMN